jgi:hypothetical protein
MIACARLDGRSLFNRERINCAKLKGPCNLHHIVPVLFNLLYVYTTASKFIENAIISILIDSSKYRLSCISKTRRKLIAKKPK